MCLLINHPANTAFDEADIADFFDHNADGIGVMWAEEGVLYHTKQLPGNPHAAWKFYQEYCKGRECVIHFRMRTHGHTDLTNCHPYEVFGDGSQMPLFMAHNGVLSTGNSKDTSKSDTWHYIRDYLHPLLSFNPELIYDARVVEILESHIGSGNKFIFMNHEGRISIVNERAFVKYKGAQLSNTYAWSAATLGGYGYRGTTGAYGGFTGGLYGRWGDEDDWYYGGRRAPTKALTAPPATQDKRTRKQKKAMAQFNRQRKQAKVLQLPKPEASVDTAGAENTEEAGFTMLLCDPQEYARDFFSELNTSGLTRAFKQLSVSEIELYYTTVGDDEAYKLLDDIIQGYASDTYVISEVGRVLLRASLAEQEKGAGLNDAIAKCEQQQHANAMAEPEQQSNAA